MSVNPFADPPFGAVQVADTTQTLLTTGGTQAILAWNSIVFIPAQTANLVITFPTVVGSLGKTITLVAIGVDAFTRTLNAFAGETTVNFSGLGELTTLNGATTFEASDTTTSRQISNLGISGSSLTDTVVQISHGFVYGQAINLTALGWVAADITNSSRSADAIVNSVVSANSFKFTTEGTLTFTAGEVDLVTAAATDRAAAGQFKVGEYYHFNSAGKWTVTGGLIYSQVIAKALSTTTARIFLTKPEALSTAALAVRFQSQASDSATMYPTVFGGGGLASRYSFDTPIGLTSGSALSWGAVNRSLVYDGTSPGRYRLEFNPGMFSGSLDVTVYRWFDVTNGAFIGPSASAASSTAPGNRSGSGSCTLEIDLGNTVREFAITITNGNGLPVFGGQAAGHTVKAEKILGYLPSTPVVLARVTVRCTPVATLASNFDQIVTGWTTPTVDTTNSFNITTGIFTAPRTANYAMTIQGLSPVIAWTVGQVYIVRNYVGGAGSGIIIDARAVSSINGSYSLSTPTAAGNIPLIAGQQLSVGVVHNQGTTITPSTVYMSITELA
jgi:hypothetical protein